MHQVQQAGLDGQRNGGQLVEVGGAAVYNVQKTIDMAAAAVLIAEQLPFAAAVQNGVAVDMDEMLLAAVGVGMDIARHIFLSNAAGAVQKHRHFGLGNLFCGNVEADRFAVHRQVVGVKEER